MISAQEALQRLREGNLRFAAGAMANGTLANYTRRGELAERQEPFAIVLGCSDSRVPAEIVFDQGLGDLFVIRVAGNVVAPSQVGSVEFAAERFAAPLVVVLGHSRCGAILATLEELVRPAKDQSRNLRSIVDRIRPSVEALLATELGRDHDTLVRHAVRANVSFSANYLRHGSEVLGQLIQRGRLLVVGAEYSLETGVVDFFDGMEGTDMASKNSELPTGWDEARVLEVIEHYEHQTDEEAATEHQAALSRPDNTLMEVPTELVPEIRRLIAEHERERKAP